MGAAPSSSASSGPPIKTIGGLRGSTIFKVKAFDDAVTATHQELHIGEFTLDVCVAKTGELISSHCYGDIPDWSVNSRFFSFRSNSSKPSSRGAASGGTTKRRSSRSVGFYTTQARQIGVCLREHCFEKAFEMERQKRRVGEAELDELIAACADDRGPAGAELYAERALLTAKAADAAAESTGAAKASAGTAADAEPTGLLTVMDAKRLLGSVGNEFDRIEVACLLYPVLIDPRNYDVILAALGKDSAKSVTERLRGEGKRTGQLLETSPRKPKGDKSSDYRGDFSPKVFEGAAPERAER